jgi:hypothetical protein
VSPRPALTCSTGQNVKLENILKPGLYNLHVKALNAQAEAVTWQAENTAGGGPYAAPAQGMVLGVGKGAKNAPGTYTGSGTSNNTGSGTSHSSLVMNRALRKPAFYEVETWPVGSNARGASVWLLIAPEPLCSPLIRSYEQAVSFTGTWPRDTPDEAIRNFRLRYLQGLAIQPDKVPTDKAPTEKARR